MAFTRSLVTMPHLWLTLLWLAVHAGAQSVSVDQSSSSVLPKEYTEPNVALSVSKSSRQQTLETCWKALHGASRNKREVTRQDFLDFLTLVGAASGSKYEDVTDFRNLDLALVTSFYTAACRPNRPPCNDGASFELPPTTRGGAIAARTQENQAQQSIVMSLCTNIMTRSQQANKEDAPTIATVQLGVDVEFDPETVPQDVIAHCLESAVFRSIRVGLGCALEDDDEQNDAPSARRQTLSELDANDSILQVTLSSEPQQQPPQVPLFRRAAAERHLSKCPVQVLSRAVSSAFISCLTPKSRESLCGTLVLEATVSIPSNYLYTGEGNGAPPLDAIASQILSQAVENGTLETFFPTECRRRV